MWSQWRWNNHRSKTLNTREGYTYQWMPLLNRLLFWVVRLSLNICTTHKYIKSHNYKNLTNLFELHYCYPRYIITCIILWKDMHTIWPIDLIFFLHVWEVILTILIYWRRSPNWDELFISPVVYVWFHCFYNYCSTVLMMMCRLKLPRVSSQF